jgi:hypothetical protein
MGETKNERVSIAVEDLRTILLAASLYLDELHERGNVNMTLALAVDRVGSTIHAGDWPEKLRREDEELGS